MFRSRDTLRGTLAAWRVWLARVGRRVWGEGRAPTLPPPRGTVPVATRVEPGKSLYEQIGERGRLITINREVVRSKPEKRIADFLYKRGVKYVYEMPIDGATPDFYLPASNIIIEHWGMENRRYVQRRWEKTRMYRARGYLLVETEKVDVPRLERILEARLLKVDPHVFDRGDGGKPRKRR
jgi:hypothetical protein